jgi:hypothetical protein
MLSAGPDLETTLLDSVLHSDECFAGVLEGRVIALWGISLLPLDGKQVGVPWLVASPEALKFPMKLVGIGKEMVARWEHQCDYMTNLTHAENTVHHRWLDRIGFTFTPGTTPVGTHQAPFRQFYRYSNV